MNVLSSCNTDSLNPYTPQESNPWNAEKARHVYGRIAFGFPETQIDQIVALGPQTVIDTIFNEALSLPNSPAPEWANWNFDDYTEEYFVQNPVFEGELYGIATGNLKDYGFKARMTFFWLNHFVTQIQTYNHAPYGFQYWTLLQTYALGNFKTFVREVSRTPAMLLYLNGFENTKANPNENYARELYELFTLSENNGYNQIDIEETARALTGYNQFAQYLGNIIFDSSTHDAGLKTIFGQTGNWGFDDVIDILFEQRGDLIALNICTKLYKFFVSPAVNEAIVSEMATTFIQSDFELFPVLEQLLRSEHFFSNEAVGQIVKSPFDMHLTYHNQMKLTSDNTEDEYHNFFIYNCATLGQDVFQPTDVAGWQRGRDWINSSTLSGRWRHMTNHSYLHWSYSEEQFRDFAVQLTENSSDPEVIVSRFLDTLLSKPLYSEIDFNTAVDVFKWDVPSNYYDTGEWNLNFGSAAYQVLLLLQHIFTLPEFHLK